MCSYKHDGCRYSSGAAAQSSRLEYIAQHSQADYNSGNVNYFAEAVSRPELHFYQPQANSLDPYRQSTETLYQIQKAQPTNIEYSFIPDDFLVPGRFQRFVGDAEEIQEEIQEAFLKTAGFEFPPDIQITICNPAEFKRIIDQPGVQGISINRKTQGLTSEIFVLNTDLAGLMLTIGHEIGHVISKPLKDKRLEEAKAFAFSKAWMKTIKEHNIAELGISFVLENPAQNGIHNIAHGFVNKFKNKNPLELYWEIVRGKHDLKITA